MSSKNQTRLALSRTTVGEEDNSDHEDNGPSYEDLVDVSPSSEPFPLYPC